MVAACSGPSPPPNPCATKPVIDGGSAEVGFGMVSDGSYFMSITDNQDVTMQLGLQGLWMFIVTARTADMDVGTGSKQGVVIFDVLDDTGASVSLQSGCRVSDFASAGGSTQLTQSEALPLDPSLAPHPDGQHLTIHLEVHDHEGHEGIDEHTVIAHLPTNP